MFTATMCEPKISVTYHHAVVEQLTRQRDNANAECRETIKELNLMTQELKSLADVMKDQTDTIDSFLETITSQKATIDELEARIAALEKPDPDLSIYELSDSEDGDEQREDGDEQREDGDEQREDGEEQREDGEDGDESECSDSCDHDEIPPEFETINTWIAVLLGLAVFYVAMTCVDPKYLRLSHDDLY
jgi:chromosome segregation ATPase